MYNCILGTAIHGQNLRLLAVIVIHKSFILILNDHSCKSCFCLTNACEYFQKIVRRKSTSFQTKTSQLEILNLAGLTFDWNNYLPLLLLFIFTEKDKRTENSNETSS